MSVAYLSLGGNLGNRRQYLANAVLALNQVTGIRVAKISSVYETQPMGVVDQPKFLNLAVELATTLAPHELLGKCLGIETSLGRIRAERWGPRTIDLDLLWFDDVLVDEPHLVLPHPRMFERAFVLVPLAEIAPELIVGNQALSDLARQVDSSGLRILGSLQSLPE